METNKQNNVLIDSRNFINPYLGNGLHNVKHNILVNGLDYSNLLTYLTDRIRPKWGDCSEDAMMHICIIVLEFTAQTHKTLVSRLHSVLIR